MTYGYEAKGLDDRMLQVANELSDLGSRTSLPGSLMVNELPFRMFLPFLNSTRVHWNLDQVQHVPEWLPWFSYKPLARFGRALAEVVRDTPMTFVRESMACNDFHSERAQMPTCHLQLNGTVRHSIALDSLNDTETLSGSERERYESAIAETLGSMHTGPFIAMPVALRPSVSNRCLQPVLRLCVGVRNARQ
jgi:hypothetical protein